MARDLSALGSDCLAAASPDRRLKASLWAANRLGRRPLTYAFAGSGGDHLSMCQTPRSVSVNLNDTF